jgi:hypothetical protein
MDVTYAHLIELGELLQHFLYRVLSSIIVMKQHLFHVKQLQTLFVHFYVQPDICVEKTLAFV